MADKKISDVAKRSDLNLRSKINGVYNSGSQFQNRYSELLQQNGCKQTNVELTDAIKVKQAPNMGDRINKDLNTIQPKNENRYGKQSQLTSLNGTNVELPDVIKPQQVPNMADRIKVEKNTIPNYRNVWDEEEEEEEEEECNTFYDRSLRRILSMCDDIGDYYNLSQHVWDRNFKPRTVNEPVSEDNNTNSAERTDTKRPNNSIQEDNNTPDSAYSDSVKDNQVEAEDSIINLENKQLATKDTVKPRNIAYRVNPETCTLEEDTTVVDEPKTITIGGRIGSERTVKQLTGEEPYLSKIVEQCIQQIKDDYNNKYSETGFPDDYYVDFGKLLISCAIREYKDIERALDAVAILIYSEGDFDNGKGTPLYHVYESVVRKNDDTGLDKLLHFIYSAKHTYKTNALLAGFLGVSKEFVKDELKSF